MKKKPIRFQPFFQVASTFSVVKLFFFGLLFSALTSFRLGIKLLLNVTKKRQNFQSRIFLIFPFSSSKVSEIIFRWSRHARRSDTSSSKRERKRVTRKNFFIFQSEEASFKMTFLAHSEDGNQTLYEYKGREPGYIATSQMLIGCALHLLSEKERFPVKWEILERWRSNVSVVVDRNFVCFRGGVITPAVAFSKTNLAKYLNDVGVQFSKKSWNDNSLHLTKFYQ